MSAPLLESIVIEPNSPATSCVIWLHGLGDSGAGFAPVVPELGLPQNHSIRFVFPHAPEQPVTVNQGYVMRSWYDIKTMDLLKRADIDGVEASEIKVQQLIADQIAKGIPANKIILGGFSQGGVVSLFTGLRYHERLAGIMGLSCYLATGDKLPEKLNDANKNTPILQHHGEQDDVVPVHAGILANKALVDAGYSSKWQTYFMPHSVLPEQLKHIGTWITQQLINE